MTDHLFPESTTYVHSYPGHKGFHAREPHHSPESSPYVYEDQVKRIGQNPALVDYGQAQTSDGTTHYCGGVESTPNKPKPQCSSLGHVELSELQPPDRNFFLAQTYRTTYSDYDKYIPASSTATRNPFSRQDDKMLLVLNATKPDLAYYGFGLPNKCCVAWSNAQSRALPNDRTRALAKKEAYNPFPGYPDKMYPFILSKELCPQYDGSFVFGYTGHQRHCLDYPDDVNDILSKDFPKFVPRVLTTNQAKLAYLPIPMCQKRNDSSEKAEKAPK